MSIDPNGTAKEIVLDFPMQRLDKLLGSFEFEGDHVNDNVWTKVHNPRAEFTLRLFSSAVHENVFDRLPCRIWPVGRRCPAGDVYNLMSALDECGQEVGPDVPTSSYDDDPGQFVLLAPLKLHSINLIRRHTVESRQTHCQRLERRKKGGGGVTLTINRQKRRKHKPAAVVGKPIVSGSCFSE
jgi:hypothetical protein